MAEDNGPGWAGKTDGKDWMQRCLIFFFRIIDIRVLYAVMACIVPFYMVFNRKGYRALRQYFRERQGFGRAGIFWAVYKNFFFFGQLVLDRFAAYAGRSYQVEGDGFEYYRSLLDSDSGFLMLGSHFGSFEMVGYILHPTKKVFVFGYGGETETVIENRNRTFAEHNITMVPIRGDMSHIFVLNEQLDKGNIVTMDGDRFFGRQRSIRMDFLGHPARFPEGPFAVAVKKKVPVISVFAVKSGTWKYKVFIKPVEAGPGTGARDLAGVFVSQLEEMVKKYPYHWFNYYDFWKEK